MLYNESLQPQDSCKSVMVLSKFSLVLYYVVFNK